MIMSYLGKDYKAFYLWSSASCTKMLQVIVGKTYISLDMTLPVRKKQPLLQLLHTAT